MILPGRLACPCLLLLLWGCDGGSTRPSDPAPLEAAASGRQAVTFSDQTAAAGIDFEHRSGDRIKNFIVEAKGGGAAFLDYDGDGLLDIYLVNGARWSGIGEPSAPRNGLFRNNGDGTFADATARAGVGDSGWGMGCAVGDFDNDGGADILVTNYGPNVLYRNQRDGTFAEGGEQSGVALVGWSTGASFGDYDNDGDLDLYVSQYVGFTRETAPPRAGMWKGAMVFAGPMNLPGAADVLYRNEGDGTFADISAEAGVAVAPPGYGLGVLFSDYDRDGDADIYVANDSVPNYLFQNQGDGTFIEAALLARVAVNAEGIAQAGMGLAYGDYDNDGWQDYLVTHFEDDYNTLYRNLGDGFFTIASFAAGLAEPSMPRLGFGACFLDADNDGDQDLVVANGHVYPQIEHLSPDRYAEPNQLFVNLGDRQGWRFSEEPAGALGQRAVSRGLCRGDYDNDGDQDLLVLNLDGVPVLLRNDGDYGNSWLSVELRGAASNKQGIGARVRVVAGDLEQTVEVVSGGSFLSHSDTRPHFGLGRHRTVDLIEVSWPSGVVQQRRQVAANQQLVIDETEGS